VITLFEELWTPSLEGVRIREFRPKLAGGWGGGGL